MEPITIDWAGLFNGVVSESLNAVQAILPLAVTILGIMTAVSIGVKVFRRLAGR